MGSDTGNVSAGAHATAGAFKGWHVVLGQGTPAIHDPSPDATWAEWHSLVTQAQVSQAAMATEMATLTGWGTWYGALSSANKTLVYLAVKNALG